MTVLGRPARRGPGPRRPAAPRWSSRPCWPASCRSGWSNDLVDLGRDRARGALRQAAGHRRGRRCRWCAACCAVAVVGLRRPLAGLRPASPGSCTSACVAAAWAYNLGLKSTVWSWVPYAVAFGAADRLRRPGRRRGAAVVVAGRCRAARRRRAPAQRAARPRRRRRHRRPRPAARARPAPDRAGGRGRAGGRDGGRAGRAPRPGLVVAVSAVVVLVLALVVVAGRGRRRSSRPSASPWSTPPSWWWPDDRPRRGTSSSSAPARPGPAPRWVPSPRTRRCGSCCSTAATSRATSRAATASPRTSLDALAEVGAADVVDGWTPLRDLELAHGDVVVAGPMRRDAYVVPRQVFDARLVEHAVAAGAVLRRHRVTSVTVDGSGPLVSGDLRAGVVVGADGAHSLVRQALLGRRREPRAIAIRGYAPVTDEVRGRQVIRFGDRRQPSYAWAFDRGDGLANVGYGELLPGDRPGPAAQPPAAPRPARAARARRRQHRQRLARAPPAAEQLALGPARRTGAARRRRRRAGQPDDRRGHLLRRRHRDRRRPHRRSRDRRSDAPRPPGRATATSCARCSARTCATPGSPPGSSQVAAHRRRRASAPPAATATSSTPSSRSASATAASRPAWRWREPRPRPRLRPQGHPHAPHDFSPRRPPTTPGPA